MREVLREEVTVCVTTRRGDARELDDDTRVVVLVRACAHRGVHLVGAEDDAPTGDVNRADVVLITEGELVHGVGAIRRRRELHRIDVIAVVSVRHHREDGLLRVEGHVHAVEVGVGELGMGEVRERPIRSWGAQHHQAPARHIAVVVDDLTVALRHDWCCMAPLVGSVCHTARFMNKMASTPVFTWLLPDWEHASPGRTVASASPRTVIGIRT